MRGPGKVIPNYYENSHFHTHMWPRRGHGNSRHSGNPEPPSCVKTALSATMKIGHFLLHVWPQRTIRHSRRSGNPEPPSCAKTTLSATMKIGHFHPHAWPQRAIRHSRRSGNPEPPSCAKTALSAKTRWVDIPISHLDHSRRPASGWTGKRTLDSRCGENGQGQIKGLVVTTPLHPDDIQSSAIYLRLDSRIPVFASSRLTPASKGLDDSHRLGSKYQGRTEPTSGRFYPDFPASSWDNQKCLEKKSQPAVAP